MTSDTPANAIPIARAACEPSACGSSPRRSAASTASAAALRVFLISKRTRFPFRKRLPVQESHWDGTPPCTRAPHASSYRTSSSKPSASASAYKAATAASSSSLLIPRRQLPPAVHRRSTTQPENRGCKANRDRHPDHDADQNYPVWRRGGLPLFRAPRGIRKSPGWHPGCPAVPTDSAAYRSVEGLEVDLRVTGLRGFSQPTTKPRHVPSTTPGNRVAVGSRQAKR